MNFIKNILGRIFAFWALIVFVVTMFIFFIPIWIISVQKDPWRSNAFNKISRVWMSIFLYMSGVRISVKGKKNFKDKENYIVVCNHNSLMDVPLTTPFLPGGNKTIAKIEMAKIPIFGTIYKTGSVLVDRKSEESRKNSFIEMKQVLDMGLHMCVYPEGTRNKTSEPLQRFHNGAFKLAIDTGKEILPTVIFNTAKVLPANKSFFLWPVKIKMHFLEPIQVESLTLEQLKEKVFVLMRDYYVSNKDQ